MDISRDKQVKYHTRGFGYDKEKETLKEKLNFLSSQHKTRPSGQIKLKKYR